MTRDIASLIALAERLEADNRDLRRRIEETDAAIERHFRMLDRLRSWRPCPACVSAGGCALHCDVCNDTGIAEASEPGHVGERVLG